MDERSGPSPDRARSRLRWLVQGGLVLAAGLLVWFLGRAAGVWDEPVPPLSLYAPLVAPPAPQDQASLAPVPPTAEPDEIVRLYLPAIAVGSPLRGGAGRRQADVERGLQADAEPRAVAALPSDAGDAPSSAAPLQLPDPRSDVPRGATLGGAPATRTRPARLPTPVPRDEAPGATADVLDSASTPPTDETTPPLAVGVGGLALPTDAAASETLSSETLPPETVSPDILSADIGATDQADRWMWPVQGEISQLFSERHRAIDVVSEHGEVVAAADRGEVVYAEWESSGFGYLVVIDHGDGYRTYYGHLYGFYVDVGQRVERGDLVGQLGNTGNSTAAHLHFEIRYLGISRDPIELLPPGGR